MKTWIVTLAGLLCVATGCAAGDEPAPAPTDPTDPTDLMAYTKEHAPKARDGHNASTIRPQMMPVCDDRRCCTFVNDGGGPGGGPSLFCCTWISGRTYCY